MLEGGVLGEDLTVGPITDTRAREASRSLADDPQLAPQVAAWAPGRLVVATAGPDWQRQEPDVREMIASRQPQLGQIFLSA